VKVSTQGIARACAGHPWRTIAAWVALILLSFAAIALLLPGRLTTEGAPTNNPESERAEDAIGRSFAFDPTDAVSDIVVVRSERYDVSSSTFRDFTNRLFSDGYATGAVLAGRSWFDSQEPSLVSEDRHATIIPLLADEDGIADLVDVVERADADPAFSVGITGENTLDHDFNELSQHDLKTGELQFGLPAALIILLLVFGAVVAGVVPLLMSIVSIIVALGLTALLAQPFELSVFVVNMLVGMGLALGIDYSLFIVSRYREERGRGRDQTAAIYVSGSTANRAVLFSGSAFVVAMFGMLLVPSSIMQSLAAGAILVGIVSVVGALTLLPALLGLIGDGVNALRIPVIGSRSIEETTAEGRFWGAIVSRVQRFPAASLVAAVAVLIAAAAPVLGLDIGANSVSTLPDSFSSKRAFVALQRDFPAMTTDPVQVVVGRDHHRPEVSQALRNVQQRLGDDPRFEPGLIRVSPDGAAALLEASVQGDPAGERAVAAVRDLREEIVPAEFAGTGAEALVGGTSSENIDYFDAVSDPAPLVFVFVLGITFILLTVAFRSIVVAATGVAINLLSVAAAYGLLVLVFQHGVGSGLLGFQQVDVIEAWVPLFLFSVLFGLSMDYQVFLLSRIRERYVQSGDTRDAVAWGVSSTARLITGAALIIVAVFLGFAMGDLVMFQQMGFGIAVALLIDATIIRSVLVPATMTLLGRWNWYLPRWLEWLPELHVEGAADDQGPR
jgi:RND superfamily putative drug exporter